jgi:MscS family membrane protein
MDQFWNQVILNNTISQYAIVAGIILVAYLLKKFVGRYTTSAFFWLMNRLGRLIERKAFIELILGPVELFLFLLISFLALQSLKFPDLLLTSFFKTNSKIVLTELAEALIILAFFSMLLRVIDYMALVMEKRADTTLDQEDNQLVVFFKDFLKVILIIIGILTMMKLVFDQNISQILAGLSIIGAAIALAARESIENLIASFIIFFDKPFTVGDMLKVNNVTGVVEKVGLRSTRIRTIEKTYVTVPNKQMVDSIVDNLSLRTQRRGELKLELDLKTSASDIEILLTGIRAILQHRLISEYSVLLSDISQQAFIVTIDYFTGSIDIQEFNLLKQENNLQVLKLLEKSGIDIAGADKNIRIIRDQPSFQEGNL